MPPNDPQTSVPEPRSASDQRTVPSPAEQGSASNLLYSGLVVGVSLALFRAGPYNLVLVLAAAALLLCNPWVRTLLELPSADASAKPRTRFDPARYLVFGHEPTQPDHHFGDGHADDAAELQRLRSASKADDEVLASNARQLSLDAIAPPLRGPVQHLVDLVSRDFVQYWYQPITFAHPGFPKAAEQSISHFVAAMYLRLRRLNNVEATSELFLTFQSVILASLRRKRRALQASSSSLAGSKIAAPPGEAELTWPSSAARIESLRRAVRKLLARNLSSADRQAPLVVSLMTEILTKQCWEAVQYIGDPDFINRQIVNWAEPASETSLQDKTISPKELEAVKGGAKSMLAATGTSSAAAAAAGVGKGPAAARHEPLQEPRGLFADTVLSQQDLGRLSSQDVSAVPSGAVTPEEGLAQERLAHSTSQASSDPLSLLGGLATSAFDTVSGAAEKTVDVVGGGLNEVGNTLFGDIDEQRPVPAPEPSGDGSVTSRRPLDSLPRPDLPPRSYRLDVPPGLPDLPLPESLRHSLRLDANDQGNKPDSSEAYTIPDAAPARSPSTSVAMARPVPAPPARASSSSAASSGLSDFPPLHEALSGQASSVYDAFETFLEDPQNPYCGPGEGESILRLYTQLNTLHTIAQFEALDGRTIQTDASNLLNAALQRLPDHDRADGRPSNPTSLRRALVYTRQRLQEDPSLATLDPLRADIYARLEQLYSVFLDRAGRRPTPQISPSSSFSALRRGSVEAARAQAATPPRPLAYEPRRKNTGQTTPGVATTVTSPLQSPISRPPSIPPRPSPVPSRSGSASDSNRSSDIDLAGRVYESGSPSERMAGPSSSLISPIGRQNASLASSHPTKAAAEVMVTDVSANASKPGLLDARSLELMIVVEGISTDGGSGDGFVLLRRWSELEALDAELQRMPRSSNPPPRLPSPKGKTSAAFCPEVETYLLGLLASSVMDTLATNPAMQRFMDKNRAGAPAETVRERGGPAAFFNGIGKNIVSGVGAVGGAVGKTAKTGLGLQTSAAAAGAGGAAAPTASAGGSARNPDASAHGQAPLSSDTAAASRTTDEGTTRGVLPAGGPSGFETGSKPTPSPGASPSLDSVSSDTSGFASRPTSPSSGLSSLPTQMSAKDLDQLLSAVFAVADEAFNLQGGWTLRRGMLRVLEQVVRTTYSSSLVSTFHEAASLLQHESFARWTEGLVESFWPDGVWSTESWPERDEGEKRRSAERAREIVVSYAPAQAGYVLGPGGRNACVEALGMIHETVCDPVTAADLGLTMVLKGLDMACR